MLAFIPEQCIILDTNATFFRYTFGVTCNIAGVGRKRTCIELRTGERPRQPDESVNSIDIQTEIRPVAHARLEYRIDDVPGVLTVHTITARVMIIVCQEERILFRLDAQLETVVA